jgi:winged helix DNA-binding protein
MAELTLTRDQILAFRRRVGFLDQRLPAGAKSLRRAAWAGLQDSMPRAAVLSLHARVAGVDHAGWAHPSLIQLWGPRYQVYVVAAEDLAPFSLGRLPDDERGRRRAERAADQLERHLGGGRRAYSEAGSGLGVNANSLRYGATTGRMLIRWEGARAPTVWVVPAPDTSPRDAQLELARRFLHVFGPSTAEAFAKWAGIGARAARASFAALEDELVPARTPIGDGRLLAADEGTMRAAPADPAAVRLLPSGDAYYLLWGADRTLLVPEPDRQAELWTSRVWPGALLVRGEVRGTWRRAHDVVTAHAWDALAAQDRAAVEAEAADLPLPGLDRGVRVQWEE